MSVPLLSVVLFYVCAFRCDWLRSRSLRRPLRNTSCRVPFGPKHRKYMVTAMSCFVYALIAKVKTSFLCFLLHRIMFVCLLREDIKLVF